MVNGVEVAKVILQGTEPVKEGETPQQKQFIVVVSTAGKNGAISTTLSQEENDIIYIYAHCEEVGKGPFPQGDPTIQFTLISPTDWVALADQGTAYGKRCACVTFLPTLPTGDAPPTAQITVSAGLGTLISAPVQLSLAAGSQYRLILF